ncbi:MAG: nascent polypeptide-associated complex protein [Candidatus Lokiarchaeota archaeon]|nr:nascent polypeptide-associated complex protein [Candidatus Lokiarchaeota archaeon]
MGFRGLSPKQLARMMKKMGIEQEEIKGVEEVIIRFDDKEWYFPKPEVTMIKQSGSETFQIGGDRQERPRGEESSKTESKKKKKKVEIPMEDAALVSNQTGVSIEAAKKALEETEGDLAAAILKLKSG